MKAWSLKSLKPDDESVRTRIISIINAANSAKISRIEIPPLTLSEFGEYSFTYNFTNFLNKEFSQDFTFKTSTFESPFVEIDELTPHVYYTNNKIVLNANLIH